MNISKVDFYFGALLSQLVNRGFSPVMKESGHDRRIYALENETGSYLIYAKYSFTPRPKRDSKIWTFSFYDSELEKTLRQQNGSRYLFAFICGEEDLANSEIILLTESEVTECISSPLSTSKWLTIEMADRKRSLIIRGNAHTKRTQSLRIPRSTDQRLEDLPTLLF
ncbi:hypothetical protein [Jeotgalibacillus proteolyticus]|uniref:Uncharacterized protein n=1 Tax=Jeotgalibacillus proteolyticus TaxID=2082395 RepID=A0A2S5G8J3_9BACL|nr:hypothetical protein [Jeotgalibacillus proteolyticus]PPA69322.1 hypothetical protein C4B60_16120 [Jeotgalibacillus proteolyticus]